MVVLAQTHIDVLYVWYWATEQHYIAKGDLGEQLQADDMHVFTKNYPVYSFSVNMQTFSKMKAEEVSFSSFEIVQEYRLKL